MRLIVILIALLVVGLLVLRVLERGTPPIETPESEISVPGGIPKVPTTPQDVKEFDQQINKFIKESESARVEQIERAQQ